MRYALLSPWLLAIFVLGWAGSVAAAPSGYITNSSDGTVSVLDIATNTVTATVPVGADPMGVAVCPDGARVYVANEFSNTAWRIAGVCLAFATPGALSATTRMVAGGGSKKVQAGRNRAIRISVPKRIQ